ncbi:hypothetical protein ACH5RR_029465 [Cinchona calisaya]|uniref:Uncharacterized protein n=1 Tax=Cinchona calisaya TaxID=153742 RepID=A0ABD2YTB2_9GENT
MALVWKRLQRSIRPMFSMPAEPSSSLNPVSQPSSQANLPRSIPSSKPTTRGSIGPMLGLRIEPTSSSNPLSQSSSQANQPHILPSSKQTACNEHASSSNSISQSYKSCFSAKSHQLKSKPNKMPLSDHNEQQDSKPRSSSSDLEATKSAFDGTMNDDSSSEDGAK